MLVLRFGGASIFISRSPLVQAEQHKVEGVASKSLRRNLYQALFCQLECGNEACSLGRTVKNPYGGENEVLKSQEK